MAFGLLIAATVFLVLSGLLGVAGATDASSASKDPAAFRVPGPRVGDKAHFNVTVVDVRASGERAVGLEKNWLSVTILPDAPVADERGATALANRVGYSGSFAAADGEESGFEALLSFEPGTHRLLVEETVSGGGRVDTTNLYESSIDHLVRRVTFANLSDPDPWTASVPQFCGLFHGLQGGPLGSRSLFPEACVLAGLDARIRLARWSLAGAMERGGANTVRYDLRGGSGGSTLASAWFAADTPYPVRVDVPNATNPARITRTLLETEAKGVAPFASSAGPPKEAQELVFAPRMPWGPDDAGVPVRFSLSAAWKQASENAVEARFRDFLRGHPGAAATGVNTGWARWTGGMDRYWVIEVSDGRDVLTACVHEDGRTTYAEDPDQSKVPGTYTSCRKSGRPVDPSCGPASMPTVASMVPRLQLVGSPRSVALGPNVWSFRIRCDEPFSMGLSHYSVSTPPASVLDDPKDPKVRYTTTTFSLLFDDAFKMRMFWEFQGVNEQGPAVLGPGGDPGSAPAATKAPASRDLWQAPAAAVAVGAAAAASLVGALYVAWPWLKKLLVLALFSRIERPAALEQSTRARVAETVAANPGIHFRSLVRETGLARGTVDHHLRKLVEVGLVQESRSDGYVCFFAAGTKDRRAMRFAPLLKAEGARRLVALVAAQPGVGASDAAEALGLSRQIVHRHVQRCEDAGVLASRRNGRHLVLEPTRDTEFALTAA
ncbi:MAG: ArsR family transcriptional regulator [Euryarchaeota archaeon]|nr:ArsR family transcriptional regulator [Euryarchaeota archaeon]